MILEIRGINSTSTQRLLEVFAMVKSLTAGRNFHALKQQIKTIRRPHRPPRSCVERAAREWKTEHEYGGDTGVLLRKLTQLPLCFGVEIVRQVGPVETLLQELEALRKFPARHIQHGGKRLLSVQTQPICVVLVYAVEDVSQQLTLELNNVFWAVNEATLQVEGIVFGQVPAGGVWLSAIKVTCFKNAFESSHAMFLVELWTLRQVGNTVKILHLEEIRPAFGAGRN